MVFEDFYLLNINSELVAILQINFKNFINIFVLIYNPLTLVAT